MARGLRSLVRWWGVPERTVFELYRHLLWERYGFSLKRATWNRILASREPPPIVFIRLTKILTGLPADIWFPAEHEEYWHGFADPIEIQKPTLVVEQLHAQNPWLAQGRQAWHHQVAAGIRPQYKLVVTEEENDE